MVFFQLGLRRVATQLARPSLLCGQFFRQQTLAPPASSKLVKLARGARSYATDKPISPIAELSDKFRTANAPKEAQDIAQTSKLSKSSSFPETSDKAVGYWLLASAASVFGIVVFGGLTRLTESGYVDR